MEDSNPPPLREVDIQALATASPKEVAQTIARQLEAARAIDVKVYEVVKLLPITSFFVVATGSSKRAIENLGDQADKLLKATSLKRVGIESDDEDRWICIDYDEVVIHVFDAHAREFYDMDHLWGDAPQIDF